MHLEIKKLMTSNRNNFFQICCIKFLVPLLLCVAGQQATTALPDSLKFPENCPLIGRYSETFGFAIHAGRDFELDDLIESSLGIPVYFPHSRHTELGGFSLRTILFFCEWLLRITSSQNADAYVQGHNDTHALVTLGYSLLYNHISENVDKNSKKLARRERFYEFISHPGLMSFDINYHASRRIQAGEEIFNFYGDGWFESRNQVEVSFEVVQSNRGFFLSK